MERVLYAAVALGGLAAALANRHFAAAAHRSSARYFGRPLRPGSADARFMTIWSRSLTIVVGLGLAVLGTLGVLGVIWKS
jgi:hypothetical protein